MCGFVYVESDDISPSFLLLCVEIQKRNQIRTKPLDVGGINERRRKKKEESLGGKE